MELTSPLSKPVLFSSDQDFSYLDQNDIRDYLMDPQSKEFRLFIEGIKCSRCVNKLEQIPLSSASCLSSRVDFVKKELTVRLSDGGKISDIAKKLTELGFQFKLIAKTETTAEQIKIEKRKDLKRIAVTGFCAGQLMIFSFAIYFGLDNQWLPLFKWLNFILFLPILFYSAIPFYKGTYQAFKNKIIHIDLPITLALWLGFLFSTWNLLQGRTEFYFDSTAGFIFLILIARFFVNQTQLNFLSLKNTNSIPLDDLYQRQDGSRLTVFQLKKDEIIHVTQGQLIPADSMLLSKNCSVDTSLLSGESEPRIYNQGMTLLAGNRLISTDAEIQVLKTYKESKISLLSENSFKNLLSKNNYLSRADQLAQRLIATVFSISLVFFFVYGFLFNFHDSFNRVLALLVVACPCALAFGSPLTLSQAFTYAKEKGIFIRNANIFEKLSHLQNIFFDKTGTLTNGHLQLTHTWPEVLPASTIQALLQLEKISYHPVAFSIRKEWGSQFVDQAVEQHQEILGVGLVGQLNNRLYEIKTLSDQLHNDDYAVALYENGVCIARLYFQDEIRPESSSLIQSLKNLNLNTFILSGDRKQKCLSVAKKCNIATENVYAELFPEDKESIIAKHKSSAMIGDGHNDMLALSKSDVGIVVSNCSSTSLVAADVYFTKSGLKPFEDLLNVNLITHQTLERNLFLSLVYNVAAGTCALLGLINPLIAALLMPLSTGIVLVSTLWGFRK